MLNPNKWQQLLDLPWLHSVNEISPQAKVAMGYQQVFLWISLFVILSLCVSCTRGVCVWGGGGGGERVNSI